MLNLCLNACDAMPNGGRLVVVARVVALGTDAAVTRQVPAAGQYVELSVADSGHGMDATTLARAFEPFFTTKARDQGTGLGLAMVHNTIRQHGGAIDVESTVGQGNDVRDHAAPPRWVTSSQWRKLRPAPARSTPRIPANLAPASAVRAGDARDRGCDLWLWTGTHPARTAMRNMPIHLISPRRAPQLGLHPRRVSRAVFEDRTPCMTEPIDLAQLHPRELRQVSPQRAA